MVGSRLPDRVTLPSRVGGIGRRDGLKHHCSKGRVGSSPTPGTNVGGRLQHDGVPHIRSQETVESALRASDAGIPDALNAVQHGVAVKTIRRWRRDYQRRSLRRGQTNCAVPCPRCDEARLDLEAYAELLGWYLGDGYLSKGRRGVYALQVFNDARYAHDNEHVLGLMRRVKPGGRPHVRDKVSNVVLTVSWKHWPCLFPSTDRGQNTHVQSSWTTGSERLSSRSRRSS